MFNLNKITGTKKSLGQILDVFNKTSDELAEFIRVTKEENDKLRQQINKLKGESIDNDVDIYKANKTLANIKSIRAQRIDAPSSSSGSSSSSSATTSYAALSPTSSSITSKEENLNSINNSSSGTTTVVTVSDINNVQNKVSVRDNNTSL